MRARILVFCAFFLVILLSACASRADSVVDAAPEPQSGDSIVGAGGAGGHPLSTRTGIEAVDAVLAAVESGDPQQLRDLIRFTVVGCTNVDGLGGPPKCQAGEVQGTPVEVLPFLGPEGSFLRAAEVGNFPGVNVTGIYAVYKVSDTAYSEEAYPVGEYAVMFTGNENQPGIVIQVRDGIVRIDYLFSSASLDETVRRDAAELILAP